MKKKILVFIPVYNEEENIYYIVESIFNKFKKKTDIFFIDDNSQDNTKKNIKYLQAKYKNIFLKIRDSKLGIGSAHKNAFIWAKKRGYNYLITMDCDGTHDPIYLNRMLEVMRKNNSHIVISNRFLNKNSLRDWPLWRKILTGFRHYLIKFLLQIKYDSSGALRIYNLSKIKLEDLLLAKHNGYSFFWESIFLLDKKKYKISEIPIYLPGRLMGKSKMKFSDILDALLYLFKIYFKNRT